MAGNRTLSFKRSSLERDKNRVSISNKTDDQIIEQFRKNIQDINAKFSFVDKLVAENDIDHANDVLRSQIVFLSSALDYYLHEITKNSIVKMFEGNKDKTSKYKKTLVPMEDVEKAIENLGDSEWLNSRIRIDKSRDTYQKYEDVKDVLNLNTNKNLIEIVQTEMSMYNDSLKNEISGVYKRRNKIAHQNDYEFGASQKNVIEKSLVVKFIKFINDFIEIVHREIITE